jgi:hypothetical protein
MPSATTKEHDGSRFCDGETGSRSYEVSYRLACWLSWNVFTFRIWCLAPLAFNLPRLCYYLSQKFLTPPATNTLKGMVLHFAVWVTQESSFITWKLALNITLKFLSLSKNSGEPRPCMRK